MKYSEAKQILDQQEKAQAIIEGYQKVASAHEQFGFKSRREFIKALQEIEQGERKKGGRGARGLSPDVIDQIKKLKDEGKSNAAISRMIGVSPLTVAKYVKGQAGGGGGAKKPARARAKKK